MGWERLQERHDCDARLDAVTAQPQAGAELAAREVVELLVNVDAIRPGAQQCAVHRHVPRDGVRRPREGLDLRHRIPPHEAAHHANATGHRDPSGAQPEQPVGQVGRDRPGTVA